ncbi:VOC family protein [Stackebrandtia soli]|uniref:VOC family protein n=1 Tax=Stackebrandtia soli TaxID=1892856 RepID=UPI0039EC246E
MKQQVHFVTLATADLDATRAFYGSLGWTSTVDVEGEIVFFQAASGLLLGFFDATKFDQDLGSTSDTSTISGVTLSHNVDSPAAVEELVDAMREAGGTVVKEPQPGAFGGIYHAHVQDPNGVIWEIGHNPHWSIDEDGTVRLG